MQERHINKALNFSEQSYTTQKYIIPYINEVVEVNKDLTVLEIGCGEGGNLKPFSDLGCEVVGIDMSVDKLSHAIAAYANQPNVQFILKDIFDVDPETLPKFDLIILRDVIEHIHNHEKFSSILKKFLSEKGIVFFGFPPWRMPFGGHQQICKNKLLSKLPYYHLLPNSIVKVILKTGGEDMAVIDSILENTSTGISTKEFKKYFVGNDYKLNKETYYFINPNYEIKFKLKPKVLPYILQIPWLKDFYTTAYFCIISLSKV